ncbi:MAG TPA: hypothetical protein VH142_21995 [Polyangiaceae bacterium]|jgi:hypothetical protein|nr:hypothetical protein [Polyangiaceae bacterium]
MKFTSFGRAVLASLLVAAGCSSSSVSSSGKPGETGEGAASNGTDAGGAAGSTLAGGNSGGRSGNAGSVSNGGSATSNGGSGGGTTGSGGTSDGGGTPSSTGGTSGTRDAGTGGSGGAVYPEPGQRTGPGVLPPATDSVTYEGKLLYDNTNIVRDLGYSGVVNGQIVWTFGDTLVTNGTGSQFAASDSAALGDFANPMKVHDENLSADGLPQEWIPLTADEQANGGLGEFAEGGTNVVEYAPNQGLVWFLKNDRGSGTDHIIGGGVATVTADENGPKATRSMDHMWESDEPNWGDVGVTYDPTDRKVYVFGHGEASMNVNGTVFLARVPAAKATDVTAYEYWDQAAKTWGTTRYGNGRAGTKTYTTDQALFSYAAHGQSNAFWSNYYNTWMFVYGADWPNSDIYVSTAPKLEGPWTSPLTIGTTCPTGTCGTLRYCTAPHPEFDASGKTLLVTWTDANQVDAVRVTWK